MFLLDDLLLAPARGLMSVFRNIYNAAQEEIAHEAESIRNQLSEMYVLLETGQVTEEEFDRSERELLERLEQIDARDRADGVAEDEDVADDDDEDDEDDEDSEETAGDAAYD
ncbi:MAG TPA: gas vesicle protein GvpG [Pirellulales bacterium]|nr:gas vesicle protein GvpG [Pirellulales bacterium]